jgi:hypothetical protein
MKGKFGQIIAILILMFIGSYSLNALAGPGQTVNLVVQWKGTGELGPLPAGVGGDVVPDEFPCVSVPMFEPSTGKRIGTGYDCVTDFGSLPTLGYGAVTTYYIFQFYKLGSIVSENTVTVQPVVTGSMAGDFSHVVGGFPTDDQDTIQGGTRAFKHAEGRVRVSGGVNVLQFPPQLGFNYLFKVILDNPGHSNMHHGDN